VVPDVLPIDEDEIDLRISVEEKVSDQATASIGFAGEYGVTGGGSVEFNNFWEKASSSLSDFSKVHRELTITIIVEVRHPVIVNCHSVLLIQWLMILPFWLGFPPFII
jgi:outer membrane protein assembly factor BamA